MSPDRWTLAPNFGLTWDITADPLPHTDTIEMSGRKVSLIARFGVDEQGFLLLERMVVFPTLRTLPNNTHASLRRTFTLEETSPVIRVDGKPLTPERPRSVRLDGLLTIHSTAPEGLELTRIIFPSASRLAALETWWIENQSGRTLDLEFDPLDFCETHRGAKGIYLIEVSHTAAENIRLQPGETYTFGLAITGRGVLDPIPWPKVQSEEDARHDFIARQCSALRFECPDPVLTRAFDFAKLRAAESVFDTAGGLMHSPGGGAYYAAVWCNDQCEYANPFFPFLGDKFANQSALNCFRLYSAFMGPDYEMIPSSIIAEGTDIWEGAGDRGDAAMYAYGASRCALALGNRAAAAELWPAIAWSLEYCRRQLTPDGVVASDSDELEGRFSTGKTNLATSSLTYGALRSAAHLARALASTTAAPRQGKRHRDRTASVGGDPRVAPSAALGMDDSTANMGEHDSPSSVGGDPRVAPSAAPGMDDSTANMGEHDSPSSGGGDPRVAPSAAPGMDDITANKGEHMGSPLRGGRDGIEASTTPANPGRPNRDASSWGWPPPEPAEYLAAAERYDAAADELAAAIERVFGATIDGYATYRYHEGLEVLRSWICLPLVMGIPGREAATAAALFSPALWTPDGLRTQAGEVTFWDRSTLYGFRGAFCAGETEPALAYFQAYSRRRLLGDHVPYAVEAYPEGNQRQLAAESALYCRVVTEGLFGITPTAFDTFTCLPRLPKDWDTMALRAVKAFERDFDLIVSRTPTGDLHLRVEMQGRPITDQTAPPGTTFQVSLQK